MPEPITRIHQDRKI